MSRARWLWAAALAAVVMTSACRRGEPTAQAQATAPTAIGAKPQEFWYGIYLQDKKIGYLSETLRPSPDNPQLLEYTAGDVVEIALMGQQLKQTTTSKIILDAALRPVSSHFSLTSGGRTTVVKAVFHADKVDYERIGDAIPQPGVPADGNAAGTSTKGSEPIPPGITLVGDERLELGRKPLKVGESFTFYSFNPVSLKIEQNQMTAESSDTLPLVGENVACTVVQLKTKWATARAWVDKSGRSRQTEVSLMQAKLRYRDETREQALRVENPGGEKVDLVAVTAIRPDRPIDNARDVRRLRAKVQGLATLAEVPQDSGQIVKDLGGGWHEVTVLAPPPGPEPALPEAQRQILLKATTYIQSDEPELRAAAHEAAKGGATPAEQAHRIQLFVRNRIHWQTNVGLFRTALEVYRDPTGVCRDAAALYTALARAAGLPTRVCAGVIYVNGAFLGHAWAETWLGDKWKPVDATLTQEVADAARLKLSEGDDYTSLFEMLPALGNLKVEVLEASTQ